MSRRRAARWPASPCRLSPAHVRHRPPGTPLGTWIPQRLLSEQGGGHLDGGQTRPPEALPLQPPCGSAHLAAGGRGALHTSPLWQTGQLRLRGAKRCLRVPSPVSDRSEPLVPLPLLRRRSVPSSFLSGPGWPLCSENGDWDGGRPSTPLGGEEPPAPRWPSKSPGNPAPRPQTHQGLHFPAGRRSGNSVLPCFLPEGVRRQLCLSRRRDLG